MINFKKILSSTSPFTFKFINQRTVKVIGIYVPGVSDYVLSKSDVILAIKDYIETIHKFYDKPIRGESMNFIAFKMHDLVPFFYTLLNLLMSVSANSETYYRFLPELKLTRFCHLPFEDEIIEVHKKDLIVEYALIRDNFNHCSCYMSYVSPCFFSSDSLDNLVSDVRSCLPDLFKDYNVIFRSV